MPDATTDHRESTARPLLFFHASGAQQADPGWVKALLDTNLPVYTHGEHEGCHRTQHTWDQLGLLLAELAEREPGRPVILLRASLTLNASAQAELERLLADADSPDAFSLFSNADPNCNPFAALPVGRDELTAQTLIERLGSRELFAINQFPTHLVALKPRAIAVLASADTTPANAASRLATAGSRVQLPGNRFAHDPGRRMDFARKLEPHESGRPVAWGELRERLLAWADRPLPEAVSEKPFTLHITHSWGGGVAQWVESFISADTDGQHLQLRSEGAEGDSGPGQCLALYRDNRLDAPLRRWWMQPPIDATDIDNPQYRQVLEDIGQQFPIGRLLVSSLVGHSLDVLRTGWPTLQVLHDHYPAWPLLGVHPSLYEADLDAAMGDPRAYDNFPGYAAGRWKQLGEAYRNTVVQNGIKLVAPSQSVVNIQQGLDPAWQEISIQVVSHGLPEWSKPTPLTIRPREDGRLRLVIPGRVQSLKGADLLAAALPELTRYAQVYLLGTGKGGERFFGVPGVNVVMEYDRQELPALLAEIGPHFAALLSVVPETFSYTLSEMQMLGLPVLATQVGSFAERIQHGKTGWLIEPAATALVAQVKELCEQPGMIKDIRDKLVDVTHRSLTDMVVDYNSLCPPSAKPLANPTAAPLNLDQAQLASQSDRVVESRLELARAEHKIENQAREVKQRTQWALDIKKELAEEIRRREAWVERTDAELAERASHINRLDEHIHSLDRQIRSVTDHRNEIQSAYETVLGSRSWKLTRPMRVMNRIIANARRARVFNPLRWPLLASQTVRNFSTLGLRGTMLRMQRGAHTVPAQRSTQDTLAPIENAHLPAKLPVSSEPMVSIIIPVFNQLQHTTVCLYSLAQARNDTPYEVIVVDDESTDDTAQELIDIEGLVLLRNKTNQGFIRSCNRGAAEAKGEYLLFLNNDTQVSDGWLDALVGTFTQRPDAGLVGARLIYPDGSLQECGGMVFSDGSGWNYGRNDDADKPEYQYLREVDYCSGACIALPSTLFNELGGFDEHYLPAYYEDTDLAFKVRQAGKKVYVQPASTIVHFEGISSGTDEQSGTKRFQAINREKFFKRWESELAGYPHWIENPEDPVEIRNARDHRLTGRILIIDAYTPEPNQDSGSVRLTNLMKCLSDSGYGVSFVADNLAWAGTYTRDLQAIGVQAWYDPWVDSMEEFLRQHGGDFDFIMISRHYVANKYLSAIKRYAPNAKFLFDTVDLHYLRESRLAELEDSTALKQVARQTRRSELAVIAAADATLVVSPVEQEILATDAPDAQVFVCSNIHEVVGSRAGFADRKDLFFVGGYQHPPNIDAAQWFVTDIWPLIRAELPDVSFHLVGSKAPESVVALGDHEGVVFHGFVETLEPFLEGCRLSVAPLRYGAGVKGKVNQSMAHGQPVVATSAAVEGIFAEHERDVLVAETARAFADEVIRLYQDEVLWNRISENAVQNVQQHFSMEAARADLEKMLEALS